MGTIKFVEGDHKFGFRHVDLEMTLRFPRSSPGSSLADGVGAQRRVLVGNTHSSHLYIVGSKA